MPKIIDYTGSIYGHLTALHKVETETKRGAVWMFRCDCGNLKEIEARQVTAGRIKTCGLCELKYKLRKETRGEKQPLTRAVSILYQRYLRNANKDGVRWELTVEQFRQLSTNSCGICGTRPIIRLKGTRLTYNKIRYNSSILGYTVNNCATCCQECDMRIGKSSLSETVSWLNKAYKYLLMTNS